MLLPITFWSPLNNARLCPWTAMATHSDANVENNLDIMIADCNCGFSPAKLRNYTKMLQRAFCFNISVDGDIFHESFHCLIVGEA